jgi:predicted Zn-dependent peptidase
MTTQPEKNNKFKSFAGDPIKVLQHTLPNGLKLFLSIHKDEPRVYTKIAVRAGSKHDPPDTTGLAHYFEHMMFKGTDRLGTLDWEKEKALLDKIEILFEQHRYEVDPELKKSLYAQIDRLSSEAATYAAANEYDKLVGALGARSTNAYTWVDQTVYVNDIPANELERWFELESERFRRPVLRLFHTELETVFEEYNMTQDNDNRKVFKCLLENLLPTHPYGTQTTIGRGEDLKNPSQTNIYRFFDQYYVPNNMAVVLCGDFDPEAALQLAQKWFGRFEPAQIQPFRYAPQLPLTRRIQKNVSGNDAPFVLMAWRTEKAKSPDSLLLPVLAGLLSNGQAGLLDLNLLQKQQLLEAGGTYLNMEDYGIFYLVGKPREGQDLATVEAKLLEQMQLLSEGQFDDHLLEAVLKDLKLSEIRAFEKNEGRAAAIVNAYVTGLSWGEVLKRRKQRNSIPKTAIQQFVRENFRKDNYVVVFKEQGPDTSVMKVDKPSITPIEVNREKISDFARQFLLQATPDIEPVFTDFRQAMKSGQLCPGITMKFVLDKKSPIFRLDFVFPVGRTTDKRIALLESYIPFLHAAELDYTELQRAFYQQGVHLQVQSNEEQLFITLSGLSESFETSVALLRKLLFQHRPNLEALPKLIDDILRKRENAKTNKQTILTKALPAYARFGPVSPFTDKLQKEELQKITAEELTQLFSRLTSYKHELFYCGPHTRRAVTAVLKTHCQPSTPCANPPKPKKYRELDNKRDKVYFVDFPIIQVDLLLMSKGTPKFNLEEYIFSNWYNQYFGHGLSSIVFQEIREAQALAYSAYAFASNPTTKNEAHYLRAYVGTQPDKLREAVETFRTLLANLPRAEQQMENARQGILKQLAAERCLRDQIYWNWRKNKKWGYPNTDIKAQLYETLRHATADQLEQYHLEYLKNRKFTWMVLGNRKKVDLNYLKTLGKVEELKLEAIFGY